MKTTKLRLVSALGLMSLWLLDSCATRPLVLTPVGPTPAAQHSTFGEGNVVVHSDTDERHLDKSTVFYVHTSYLIETRDGRRVRWVANHLGDMDELPQRVSLPVGTYTVVARSEDYGRVRVPVVIVAGRTTEVHLEDAWKPCEQPVSDTALVRFPNGYVVGWAVPAETSGPDLRKPH
jgi:hypothetical protein